MLAGLNITVKAKASIYLLANRTKTKKILQFNVEDSVQRLLIFHAPFKHPAANELSLERVLYALSDSIRLDIVRHLSRVETASCGELDSARPKSTASHHFKVLREACPVCTENTGTMHMNALRRADIESRFPGLFDAIFAQHSS